MLKDQFFKTIGLQFDKGFSGPKSTRDFRQTGARSSIVPKTFFGPEKPFVKFRPAYSVKLVFSKVVKGIKIKIGARFLGTTSF